MVKPRLLGVLGLVVVVVGGVLAAQTPASDATPAAGPDTADHPTLYEVFELKMEPRKGEADVYVIDHIEHPTAD
jgi:hypothetical protein